MPTAYQLITAAPTIEAVAPETALYLIIASPTYQSIATRTAEKEVSTVAPIDLVVARSATDDVYPRRAAQHVASGSSLDVADGPSTG